MIAALSTVAFYRDPPDTLTLAAQAHVAANFASAADVWNLPPVPDPICGITSRDFWYTEWTCDVPMPAACGTVPAVALLHRRAQGFYAPLSYDATRALAAMNEGPCPGLREPAR